VFWLTAGTSSLDIITIVNGLPDRIGQIPFNSGSQALNWIASSSNYFAVGPPYEQIDADSLGFCFEGNQIISYPTTGSTWYDLSGNGNNGTFQNGGPSFNINGWLSFDGTDDFIQIPDSATTSNTSSLSICALVKFNSLSSTYQGIIGKGSGSNPDANEEYVLSINNANLYFDIGIGSGPYINPSLSLTTGRWYHISVTQARTNGTSSLVAYSNGNPLSATVIGSLNTPNNNEYPVSIGRRAYSGFPYGNDSFNGDMASIQLYLKTLSATEVLQNYYQGPVVTGSISGSYYANNLVSYVSGSTNTYNLSANIISGSLQNGVGYSPLNGGYWSFDGSDDRILLEGSTQNAWILNSPDSWTVNAWIRVPIGSSTSTGLTYQGILSNTSGGPAYNVFQIVNSTIGYSHYNNGWITDYGTIPVNDGKWHMLTWVNQSNSLTFYVDSISNGTINSTITGVGWLDVIGSSLGTSFLGDIASLQINKGKAFTAAEVLQQYNATK
jgi:hypothetical protein